MRLVVLSNARIRIICLLFCPRAEETVVHRFHGRTFSRVEYMYILLVEHQLKETAQRRRDKAIDCNAIAREYKRRERGREKKREMVSSSLVLFLAEKNSTKEIQRSDYRQTHSRNWNKTPEK